LTELMPPPI